MRFCVDSLSAAPSLCFRNPSYSTIPAAEEPLVAKPQGKSLKALVAGAAVASFALGALAATAVSATVAAPTTSFMKPMYVFNKSLGTKTFDECVKGCPDLSGNDFKKGQMTIPCITSFDMNHQLLAWMTRCFPAAGRRSPPRSLMARTTRLP